MAASDVDMESEDEITIKYVDLYLAVKNGNANIVKKALRRIDFRLWLHHTASILDLSVKYGHEELVDVVFTTKTWQCCEPEEKARALLGAMDVAVSSHWLQLLKKLLCVYETIKDDITQTIEFTRKFKKLYLHATFANNVEMLLALRRYVSEAVHRKRRYLDGAMNAGAAVMAYYLNEGGLSAQAVATSLDIDVLKVVLTLDDLDLVQYHSQNNDLHYRGGGSYEDMLSRAQSVQALQMILERIRIIDPKCDINYILEYVMLQAMSDDKMEIAEFLIESGLVNLRFPHLYTPSPAALFCKTSSVFRFLHHQATKADLSLSVQQQRNLLTYLPGCFEHFSEELAAYYLQILEFTHEDYNKWMPCIKSCVQMVVASGNIELFMLILNSFPEHRNTLLEHAVAVWYQEHPCLPKFPNLPILDLMIDTMHPVTKFQAASLLIRFNDLIYPMQFRKPLTDHVRLAMSIYQRFLSLGAIVGRDHFGSLLYNVFDVQSVNYVAAKFLALSEVVDLTRLVNDYCYITGCDVISWFYSRDVEMDYFLTKLLINLSMTARPQRCLTWTGILDYILHSESRVSHFGDLIEECDLMVVDPLFRHRHNSRYARDLELRVSVPRVASLRTLSRIRLTTSLRVNCSDIRFNKRHSWLLCSVSALVSELCDHLSSSTPKSILRYVSMTSFIQRSRMLRFETPEHLEHRKTNLNEDYYDSSSDSD